MAWNRKTTSYDVHPIENPDGTLAGLRITQDERVDRLSDADAVLKRGEIKEVASIEIPWRKVEGLARDLINWPLYYASGNAARDRRDPVSWPNSA